jgi:hypothetical protein
MARSAPQGLRGGALSTRRQPALTLVRLARRLVDRVIRVGSIKPFAMSRFDERIGSTGPRQRVCRFAPRFPAEDPHLVARPPTFPRFAPGTSLTNSSRRRPARTPSASFLDTGTFAGSGRRATHLPLPAFSYLRIACAFRTNRQPRLPGRTGACLAATLRAIDPTA